MTRRALVIGCGGVAGGAWTIAMLDSLANATGWDPRQADILMGTSSGSVIVSLLGGGISIERMMNNQHSGHSQTTRWNHDVSSGGALPPLPASLLPGAPQLVWQGLRGRVPAMTALSGLLPQGRLDIAPLTQLIDGLATENSWVPHPATWVVAVDDKTGERVAFGSPDAPRVAMRDAVCASCAIPGWAPPIEMAGRRYLDGGIASPISADLLADKGIDEVVIISPMASRQTDRPRSILMRMERLMRKVMTQRVTSEIRYLQSRGIRVLWLEPVPEDLASFGYNMMDPKQRKSVFDTALQTTPETVRLALRTSTIRFT